MDCATYCKMSMEQGTPIGIKEREDNQYAVGFLEMQVGQDGKGIGHKVPMAQHDALGLTGSAGCIEDTGKVSG